jgi:acyl-CoA synthetase (NDP forming)
VKEVDHFLDGFFRPRSIGVVGATNNPVKVNFRLILNLVSLNFKGRIYPVNPNEKEILGINDVNFQLFPLLENPVLLQPLFQKNL